MTPHNKKWRALMLFAALATALAVLAPAALAHPDADEDGLHLHDLSAPLVAQDAESAALADVVSSGPTAKVTKNLDLVGRGDRLVAGATTDVWAHAGYAYTGTFNSPCNTPEAGVWVWNVQNKNNPSFVGVIQSEPGDRTNDVKVASMNSGDILVMSNESCGGGDGGFEVYNVDDPTSPVKLASVTIDEMNPIASGLFGGVTNVGVHNLWLFTQGDKDYVAAVSESVFDNFQIYDITTPGTPTLVGKFGAEEIFDPGVANDFGNFGRVLNAAIYLISGFGSSANRFLHDITISADGNMAYLSNWDAGLVLLDISDPTTPTLVSVAIDPINGSLDGEVNSHAAWPSEDGTIVVETEEDFDNTDIVLTVNSGPLTGSTFTLGEMSNNDTPFSAVSPLTADVVYVGQGCNADAYLAPAAGKVAIIRRGACSFFEKVMRASAEGAVAAVVANNVAGNTVAPGNFTASGATGGIPALTMSTVDGNTFQANPGNNATLDLTFEPWGGVRIWDYADPSAPVLASLFDTVCSADGGDPSCDPAGTYSVHNVQVETRGNKTFAYISWYTDGMLVVDVTDPYNPVEVARYFDNTADFVASNGGSPHSYWGVYKETNSPFIYGSDRNGGLRIFKEKGAASDGKGASKKP